MNERRVARREPAGKRLHASACAPCATLALPCGCVVSADSRLLLVGYIVPRDWPCEVENDRYHCRDLDRMGLVELRVERSRVESALVEAKRLDPEDDRRRWLAERWHRVGDALAREENSRCDG